MQLSVQYNCTNAAAIVMKLLASRYIHINGCQLCNIACATLYQVGTGPFVATQLTACTDDACTRHHTHDCELCLLTQPHNVMTRLKAIHTASQQVLQPTDMLLYSGVS